MCNHILLVVKAIDIAVFSGSLIKFYQMLLQIIMSSVRYEMFD